MMLFDLTKLREAARPSIAQLNEVDPINRWARECLDGYPADLSSDLAILTLIEAYNGDIDAWEVPCVIQSVGPRRVIRVLRKYRQQEPAKVMERIAASLTDFRQPDFKGWDGIEGARYVLAALIMPSRIRARASRFMPGKNEKFGLFRNTHFPAAELYAGLDQSAAEELVAQLSNFATGFRCEDDEVGRSVTCATGETGDCLVAGTASRLARDAAIARLVRLGFGATFAPVEYQPRQDVPILCTLHRPGIWIDIRFSSDEVELRIQLAPDGQGLWGERFEQAPQHSGDARPWNVIKVSRHLGSSHEHELRTYAHVVSIACALADASPASIEVFDALAAPLLTPEAAAIDELVRATCAGRSADHSKGSSRIAKQTTPTRLQTPRGKTFDWEPTQPRVTLYRGLSPESAEQALERLWNGAAEFSVARSIGKNGFSVWANRIKDARDHDFRSKSARLLDDAVGYLRTRGFSAWVAPRKFPSTLGQFEVDCSEVNTNEYSHSVFLHVSGTGYAFEVLDASADGSRWRKCSRPWATDSFVEDRFLALVEAAIAFKDGEPFASRLKPLGGNWTTSKNPSWEPDEGPGTLDVGTPYVGDGLWNVGDGWRDLGR